jgi:hypothetical protein
VLRVGLDLKVLTEEDERQGVELNFAFVRQCCESHRHPPVTVHSRRTTTNNQQPPNPITMLSNFEFQNRCLHPPQPNLSSCRSPTPCNILHPEHCSSTSPKSTSSRRQQKFSEPNRSEPTAFPQRLAPLAPEPSSNASATSHLLRSRQENSIGRACIAPLNPAARHITTSTQRRLPSTDSSRPWTMVSESSFFEQTLLACARPATWWHVDSHVDIRRSNSGRGIYGGLEIRTSNSKTPV